MIDDVPEGPCIGEGCAFCAACVEQGWTCRLGTLTGDEIDAYLRVLQGCKSPLGFWAGSEGLARGKLLLRFAIQHIVGIRERADFCMRYDKHMLKRLALQDWTHEHYSMQYSALDAAFREFEIMPWELPRVPYGFWDSHDACVAALRWFLEKQGWTPRDCHERLRTRQGRHVRDRMAEYGLTNLYDRKDLIGLLLALDPLLDPRSSAQIRHDQSQVQPKETMIECPWCEGQYRSLTMHVVQVHPTITSDDMDRLLENNARETQELKAKRKEVTRETRRKLRPPPRVISDHIVIPQEHWIATKWVAFDMAEWSESLEVRRLTSPSGDWKVYASAHKQKTSIYIYVPPIVCNYLRRDTTVRVIGHGVISFRFKTEESRQAVWEWYQRRAKQQEQPETNVPDSLHRQQWLNP